MSSEFYKAPTISDVWSSLDSETKDRVARMFIAWLVDCLKKVNLDNLALFGGLISYHKKDLMVVFSYMLKEEYAPYVEHIVKLFGLST